MLEVTDIARDNLLKVLDSETAQDKQLIIYFQGFG